MHKVLITSVMSDFWQRQGLYNLPGFSVHGILQARKLEWVAIPFSRGSSHSGIEPSSTALAGRFFTAVPPGKPESKRDECKYEIWPKYSPLQGVRGRVWEGQGNGAEK